MGLAIYNVCDEKLADFVYIFVCVKDMQSWLDARGIHD